VGSYEDGNEPSVTLKGGGFLAQLIETVSYARRALFHGINRRVALT
jgi:hypothetical protein